MIDLDDMESLLQHCKELDEAGGLANRVTPSVVIELITLLRQEGKDAARYRWIKANGQLGVGRCGIDWELYFEGPAPDNSAMIERHIDEAMQCK